MFVNASSRTPLLPKSGSNATLFRYRSGKGSHLRNDHIVTYFPNTRSLLKLAQYVHSIPSEFEKHETLHYRTQSFTRTRHDAYKLIKSTYDSNYRLSSAVYLSASEMMNYLNGNEGLKREVSSINDFELEFNKQIQIGSRKIVRGIEGTEFDFTAKYIGRYDQTFRQVKRVNQKGRKRVKNVHILKNFGTSHEDRQYLPIQALIFTKLIEVLESKGYAVKVSTINNMMRQDREYGASSIIVPIKDYGERFSTKNLLIGNHGYKLISLIFAAILATQYHDLECGYRLTDSYLHNLGYPLDIHLKDGRYIYKRNNKQLHAPFLTKMMDCIERRETTILATNLYDLGATLTQANSKEVTKYLAKWLLDFEAKIEAASSC